LEAQSTAIRKQILTGGNLEQLPQRTPLNPIIKNKRSYTGYSVEAALIEARTGFYVYGILYRPIGFMANVPVSCALMDMP
jgi:hypothetical protein